MVTAYNYKYLNEKLIIKLYTDGMGSQKIGEKWSL